MPFAPQASGFCVFNDIAVAIQWLRAKQRIQRAAVIDLDVHQGDGTAQIFEADPSVLTLSMHAKSNFPFRKQRSKIDIEFDDGTDDPEYLNALSRVLPRVFAFEPDIVFYQSGVDPLASDTLGRLALTPAGLQERDRRVLAAARAHGVPIVITLGGGYSRPIELTARSSRQYVPHGLGDFFLITLDDIRTARERIAGRVIRTPLVSSSTLSARLGTQVFLKLELFQKTGSFKVRGAFNKVLSIPEKQRGRGLVAVSGGNHAQAVAYVGRQLGLPAVILMPQSTPRNYIEATQGYGAEVVLVPSAAEAFDEIAGYETQGWTAIHPFDDPLVMAGQGTVGLEIVEDEPELTDVVVSIGGGGFIGGVAAL